MRDMIVCELERGGVMGGVQCSLVGVRVRAAASSMASTGPYRDRDVER